MEDYDTFVQRQLSQLRRNEAEEAEEEVEGDHIRPSSASSVICVHGRPILPPLLSGEQREEMQRLRESAQKAADHRRLKDDPRMAYVHTILHSVQLRPMPTLEDFLQGCKDYNNSPCSQITSGESVPHDFSSGTTKEGLSLPPPSVNKGKDMLCLQPVTSSASFYSDTTSKGSYHGGCVFDQHHSLQAPQPKSPDGFHHQSMSSGYVSFRNMKNAISVSAVIDTNNESRDFAFSEGTYTMNGFFLHSRLNTITKMPEIICHPHIDGEDLERSGLELSFCNNLTGEQNSCFSPFQDNSFTCERLAVERFENSHLENTQSRDNSGTIGIHGLESDHILDKSEVFFSLSENGGSPDHSESPETTGSHRNPMTQPHRRQDPIEREPADNSGDETTLSKELCSMSLQALLQKSQEYRRRQRMLRNQNRNTKIQEKNQEPKTQQGDQSHSDKENEESPSNANGKIKERRRNSIPTHLNQDVKSESKHLTIDVDTKETAEVENGETPVKNNMLNSSLEVLMEPKEISAFFQQQPVLTDTSQVQEAFHRTDEQSHSCPTGVFQGVRKSYTILAPHFCRSPVRSKSKSLIREGPSSDGAEILKGKVMVNTLSTEDQRTEEERNLEVQNGLAVITSTVNLTVPDDVSGVSVKSSEQVDQLESNLSCLMMQISDLELTVKGNYGNHGQTDGKVLNESAFKTVEQSEKSRNDIVPLHDEYDSDNVEYKLGSVDLDDGFEAYRELPSRQSFNMKKNTHEDITAEPVITHSYDSPITVPKSDEALNLSDIRLVKTLAIERRKEKAASTKSCGVHGGCRGQQPPSKCILSAAQWMRIPDVFRNIPSEIMHPCDMSVLSDTTNHLVERRMTERGHDSSHSQSLNHSYDVNTPSGLWLQDVSGSDSNSRGHLVQEKHLTPEGEGEGQSGLSKVKRRLVLHTTEDSQGRRVHTQGGGGSSSMVRPSSINPKAAELLNQSIETQKNLEEQLRQVHAAQLRALQEEHKRQQDQLLQAFGAHYPLLQSASSPCSVSASRLGDTLTFPTLSQPFTPLSEHHCHLLAAMVRGFLTRRLLRTEKVAQLVRTVRDTQQFLFALQQSPCRGELCSRQDLILQERVALQLRAARYKVYDIFFSLSARKRMQLISWDRELVREREFRRQDGDKGHPGARSSLSAATQKALERKRDTTIQRKTAERHREVVTGHKTGFSAKWPLEARRGQFRANPQRVPKCAHSTRPR